MSIQPFGDIPYIANSGVNVFLFQITIGGMVCPEALTHPTTVICDLSLEAYKVGFFDPRQERIFGGLGLNGKPDSSILKIYHVSNTQS